MNLINKTKIVQFIMTNLQPIIVFNKIAISYHNYVVKNVLVGMLLINNIKLKQLIIYPCYFKIKIIK